VLISSRTCCFLTCSKWLQTKRRCNLHKQRWSGSRTAFVVTRCRPVRSLHDSFRRVRKIVKSDY
jgi:hypothetical protein